MGKILFRNLEKQEHSEVLPKLFRILYTNMSSLAPTGCTYEEDQNLWLSYILPELDSGRKQIMLMLLEDSVVGYAQYSVEADTLAVDEVEILPRYQKTTVFYRFCQHMMNNIPETVRYMTSYVRKENRQSISIHEGLGMEQIGENKTGTSWFYRGRRESAEARFRR